MTTLLEGLQIQVSPKNVYAKKMCIEMLGLQGGNCSEDKLFAFSHLFPLVYVPMYLS